LIVAGVPRVLPVGSLRPLPAGGHVLPPTLPLEGLRGKQTFKIKIVEKNPFSASCRKTYLAKNISQREGISNTEYHSVCPFVSISFFDPFPTSEHASPHPWG
jgi:hypothetical protein